MSIETMSEEQLEELLCTKAERVGYMFRVEQIEGGLWSASFTARADKPGVRPVRSVAKGPDRKRALQIMAYVVTNPGVAPRRSLSD